jgi:hypothetical protein
MNLRIKELARQAGAGEWGDSVAPAMMNIEKFAALVRADEREACAKVADRQNGDDEEDPESCVWSKTARHIAAAIRARGEK